MSERHVPIDFGVLFSKNPEYTRADISAAQIEAARLEGWNAASGATLGENEQRKAAVREKLEERMDAFKPSNP